MVPRQTYWVEYTFADGLLDKISGFCERNIISTEIMLFICMKKHFCAVLETPEGSFGGM